jgi:hypothetical protein
MPSNDFLPFGTGGGAAVLSNAAYAALPPSAAFSAGILTKEKLNKVLRQSAVMAAAVGGFIQSAGFDALDDGDVPALQAHLRAAIDSRVTAGVPTSTQMLAASGYQVLASGLIIQWGSGTDSGGADLNLFPIAFPAACFGVSLTHITGVLGTGIFEAATVNLAPSLTGYYAHNGNGATVGHFFIAIGH